MTKKMLLNKYFGENILTRNSIISFFNKVEMLDDNEIIIDFKKIKFISRSCAAEYLKLKGNSQKRIAEKNMSIEVKLMFRLVVNQLKNLVLVE